MSNKKRFLLAAVFLLAGVVCTWAAGDRDILTGLKVIELPFPPGERSIVRLAIGPDGNVYGTILVPSQKPRPFRYDPQKKEAPVLIPGPKAMPMMPVPPGVKAWTWTVSWREGYALSSTGEMQFHKQDGTMQALGQVAGTRPFEEAGYQVSKAFFFDAEGNVYTAGKDGAIYRYSPAAKKLEALKARLPAVRGRESWASLDAAVTGPDGLVYGGTFDGYLFTFDPKTQKLVNLGKPLRQQGIRGLAFSKGTLYGVGGEDEGLPRAFAFNLETRGFELGGMLKAGNKNISEPIGAVAADEQGDIYIGTTGRLGNLYVWEVK